jgi:hypothetical protein
MSRLPASDRGDESAKIAGGRWSKLQERRLCWLDAERRTDRLVPSSPQQLLRALPNAKGNVSHSLRLLEAHGLVEIGRSPGGHAEHVRLAPEGCQKASAIAGNYD